MSEITKLYENVGIVPKKNCYYWDCPYSTGNVGEDEKREKDCESCNNPDKKVYPPLTAEKQLELIKLLSYYYNITISKNFENDYKFQCEGDDVRPYVFTSGQDFAEQLAVFVNMCFEYLPEEEKQQIKEILK